MTFKNLTKQLVSKHPAFLNFVDIGRAIFAPSEQYALWNDYYKTLHESIFLREHKSIVETK